MPSKAERQRRKALQKAAEDDAKRRSSPETSSSLHEMFAQLQRDERDRRRRFRVVDADLISAETDDALFAGLYSHLIDSVGVGASLADLMDRVQQLPEGYRLLLLISGLQGEVDNGGYNQYFFNSTGQFAEATLEALKTIGASEHVVIHDEAIRLFRQAMVDAKMRAVFEDRDIDRFFESYEESLFDECDSRFSDRGDGLQQMFCAYVRAHPELFAHA